MTGTPESSSLGVASGEADAFHILLGGGKLGPLMVHKNLFLVTTKDSVDVCVSKGTPEVSHRELCMAVHA